MTDEDEVLDARGARAIAAVAAAAAIAAPAWLLEQNRVAWCIEVLDAASRATGPAIDGHVSSAIIPNDPHIYAVRGFAALVAGGVQDDRVRSGLLRLSIDRRLRVVAALAGVLRTLWIADRALAWEIIALGVQSNLLNPYHGYTQERDPVRDEALLAPHMEALQQGTPSQLERVRVENEEFFAHAFLNLAQGVPIDLMWADDHARTPLVTLTEDLVRWTIATERQAHARDQYARNVPDDWDDVFGGWLARVAGVADEAMYDRLVRVPLEHAATEPLPLVPDYLQSYMWVHFDQAVPDQAVPMLARRRWEAFTRWLLETAHVREYRERQHVSHQIEEMISVIIFMRYGSPLFKPTWTCAPEFALVLGAWTNAVAPCERGFSTLLPLLERFAPQFTPNDVVMWLTQFASEAGVIDPTKLSGDRGDRTAHVLNSIWSKHRDAILSSHELRTQYGSLVDALLAAGIALAGTLADRLRAP